jgi:hypothetical protein
VLFDQQFKTLILEQINISWDQRLRLSLSSGPRSVGKFLFPDLKRKIDSVFKVECQSAVCEYRSVACEYRSAACEYRSAACEYRSAACEYRSVVCEYRSAVCEHRSSQKMVSTAGLSISGVKLSR